MRAAASASAAIPAIAAIASRIAVVVGALVAGAGCYSPDLHDGQYTCGVSRHCPAGYECNDCGACVRSGESRACVADLSVAGDGSAHDAEAAPPDLASPDLAPRACALDGGAGCGAGSVCCKGECRAGDCCVERDCKGGLACVGNRCVACVTDGDCGGGELCSGGQCAAGCDGAVTCGAGSVCCGAAGECRPGASSCTGVCFAGGCCSDAGCVAGYACAPDHVCRSRCTNPQQCGGGNHCCLGFCTAGACVATVAGSGLRGPGDAPSGTEYIDGAFGLSAAPDGSLFFVDARDASVRVINRGATPIGSVPPGTTGRVTGGILGCKAGPALSAEMWTPWGLARDGAGNLYIADANCYVVWKLSADFSTVTLLAGQIGVSKWADGTGMSAAFVMPAGITFDATSNALFVTDYLGSRIRKVTLAGVVTTVAGDGTAAELDGPAASARLLHPSAIAAAPGGSLVVGDWDAQTVRLVTSPGAAGSQVTTILPAGRGLAGLGSIAVAANGTVYLPLWDAGIWRLTPVGNGSYTPSQVTSVTGAIGVTLDTSGKSLWIGGWLDGTGPVDNTIERTNLAGVQLASYGQSGMQQFLDGPGSRATFAFGSCSGGVALDAAGALWVADRCAHRVRRVAPDGTVTSFGSGLFGVAAGDASTAQLCLPSAIATSGTDVYVVDSGCGAPIYKIAGGTTASIVGHLCIPGDPGCLVTSLPSGMVVDPAGDLLVSVGSLDNGAPEPAIVRVPALGAGVPSLFAGAAGAGGCVDGAPTVGRFGGGPLGLARDAAGTLYAADGQCGIRTVSPTGALGTAAPGLAIAVTLGPVVAGKQTLYATDGEMIVSVDPVSRVVLPYAGRPVTFDMHFADGLPSQAMFWEVSSLAADAAGDIYVLDQYNSRIRVIYP